MDVEEGQDCSQRITAFAHFPIGTCSARVGAVTPSPFPTSLWYCLKMIETITPQELVSQAKFQMRTEAKLKVMEEHSSHDRSALMGFCASGGDALWVEGRTSLKSVVEP